MPPLAEERPVLLFGLRHTQQRQHRPGHEGFPGCHAGGRVDRARGGRPDSALPRDRVHLPVRGAGGSGPRVAAVTDRRVALHGHDTWGQGVANALAAAENGATLLDGALGGLGGCPFAPGASGNTASEDLLFALRPDWLTPQVLADLVAEGEDLLMELGEPNRSKAAQGIRSKSSAFPWAVGPRI
ncbi:hypothetical protein [Streptomyces bingchenggensis]|uniref:hypothetical protein n=1 Tax=Streptomyces bingchenggensis TaxID=379067 RepID=UPI001EE6718B|nr:MULTISPECIES: hypothetical protein [Streptomyces]